MTPKNFNTAWRAVRAELAMPDVTSHGFRKTVATLIDDVVPSARIGADHLGHAKLSMTHSRFDRPPCEEGTRQNGMPRSSPGEYRPHTM